MMEEHWFIRKSRQQARDIINDRETNNQLKRQLLSALTSRIDGASLMIEGQPQLFRACRDLRNEVDRWRNEIL